MWRKASKSDTGANCVEVARTGHVRDSKNANGPTLAVDLTRFLDTVKAGQFDR
jgi:hypothetical protein